MNYFDDPSCFTAYQFARWPTSSISRPPRSSSAKKSDNQHSSKQYFVQHNVPIQTESRIRSPVPLFQPTPTPDLYSIDDQTSSVLSMNSPSSYLTPVRIQSATLTIPLKTTSDEIKQTNLAQQSHERRKVVQERKLRKQQTSNYTHVDSDVWLQLKQSSASFKHLATTNLREDLVDSNASRLNAEKYSFEALKQAINQQQNEKKITTIKSESDSRPSSNIRSRTNVPTSASSSSHSRATKRPTEIYLQPVFEPFIVAAKPLHPLLLTGNLHSSKTQLKLTKPPSSAPPRIRRPPPPPRSSTLISTSPEPPMPLLISNSSTNDDPSTSPTHPSIVKETDEPTNNSPPTISQSPTRPETASNTSLKSSIKLQNQVPRCRSATDAKTSLSFNKISPRFILITDDEHRIESWYHRYPFIISDDFLQAFQIKPNQSTISAYFIDESHTSLDLNQLTKGYLHDKPFHLNHDWKKYDLIFISDKVYFEVIIHLQVMIHLMSKSSGKIIHIRQINHQKDLKTQITVACKQFNQPILSHV